MIDIHKQSTLHDIVLKITIKVEDEPTIEEVLARIHEKLIEMRVFDGRK